MIGELDVKFPKNQPKYYVGKKEKNMVYVPGIPTHSESDFLISSKKKLKQLVKPVSQELASSLLKLKTSLMGSLFSLFRPPSKNTRSYTELIISGIISSRRLVCKVSDVIYKALIHTCVLKQALYIKAGLTDYLIPFQKYVCVY